ncbi:MAG: RGCVC family protein [Jatrophihabitantaceae bacterium]
MPTATQTSSPAPVLLDESEPVAQPCCDSCPHPSAAHDAIAARYCAATRAMTGGRGCICRS